MYLLTFNAQKGNSRNIMYWKEVIEEKTRKVKEKKIRLQKFKTGWWEDGRKVENRKDMVSGISKPKMSILWRDVNTDRSEHLETAFYRDAGETTGVWFWGWSQVKGENGTTVLLGKQTKIMVTLEQDLVAWMWWETQVSLVLIFISPQACRKRDQRLFHTLRQDWVFLGNHARSVSIKFNF